MNIKIIKVWIFGEKPPIISDRLYGVGVVVDSKYEGLAAGDVVVNSAMDSWPWQLYFKVNNKNGEFKKFEFKDEDPKFELTYYGKSSV